ncbi:MAG: cell division protein FtsA [Hyphomicrobiales bacterium]|jgi:cell division protein FtsA|nr:cell division protein FtsA [Hyphomicrobiales bacterium]
MHLMSFDRISRKFTAKINNTVTAAIDIGSDKILCLIVRNIISENNKYSFDILGIGHNRSMGFESGIITDPAALELAIRTSIQAAEEMSSLTVDKIVVNISSEAIESNLYEISVPIKDTQVSKKDIETAFMIAEEQNVSDDKVIIETMPLGFSIDGVRSIEDPVGMYGKKLDINISVITCKRSIVQNLNNVIENAHAKISKIIISPFASAIATLSSDEANLGTILIDMGAGTTSYSVFSDGIFKYAGVSPIGGNYITKDIARTLSIPIVEAEKLKILYGGVLTNSYDNGDLLNMKMVGYEGSDGNDIQISKSIIAEISRTRALDIFQKVRDNLINVSESLIHNKRIVLTGGGSQLIGIDDLAGEVFNSPIRRAVPQISSEIFDISDPIFSNVIGLLTYSQNETFVNKKITTQSLSYNSNNFFSNLLKWFRDSF